MAVTFSSAVFGVSTSTTLNAVTTGDIETTPVATDRIVLSDSTDSNRVKLIRVDALPSGTQGPKGDPGPQGAPGGVASFNGRTGVVMPATNDYTAEMVGASPNNHVHAIADIPGLVDSLAEKSVEVLLPDMTVNGTTPLGGAALFRGTITSVSLNNTDKMIIVINIANGPVVVTTTSGFTLMNPDGSAGGTTYSLPNGGTKAVFWRRTVQQWMRIQ